MKEITSLDDLPKCRLSVRSMFPPGHYPNDAQVSMTKDTMRHKLAAKMLENDDIFKVSFSRDEYMTVYADVVVMTPEQFTDLMLAQFKRGVKHGLYYATPFDHAKATGGQP